jgi:hypothetical protein
MGIFLAQMIIHFAVAFGVVLGASLMSGIGSILTLQPPTITMEDIAKNIKIWAVIAAVGGTIDPFRTIESHVIDGELSPALKQVLLIVSAFMGAHIGTKLVHWLCNGEMFS